MFTTQVAAVRARISNVLSTQFISEKSETAGIGDKNQQKQKNQKENQGKQKNQIEIQEETRKQKNQKNKPGETKNKQKNHEKNQIRTKGVRKRKSFRPQLSHRDA